MLQIYDFLDPIKRTLDILSSNLQNDKGKTSDESSQWLPVPCSKELFF